MNIKALAAAHFIAHPEIVIWVKFSRVNWTTEWKGDFKRLKIRPRIRGDCQACHHET